MAASGEPRVIASQRFYRDLLEAGVIREGEKIRNITIVAEDNEPVMIYVERYGDERLLHVTHGLHGTQAGEE